ncbi:hypothetical protein ACLB2K_067220 [Fragaria x ananassa]
MKWANAYLPVGTVTVESFNAINTLIIGGNVSLPVGTLTTPSSSFNAIDTYRKLLKNPFDFSHVVVDVTTLHFETSASLPDLRHRIHQALTRALIPTYANQSEQYQPLLLRLDSHSRIPNLSSAAAVEEFLEERPIALRWWPWLVAWESRLLWILSGSSIVVSIFNCMLSFVTLMFCGHLSALELVGLQGIAYGIMLGMASAVQTVCGQAYGAKHLGAMGIICQRAIILHLGAAIPPHTCVLVVRSNSSSHWPISGHSRAGSNLRKRLDPSALCICHKLPAAEVPSSTEHSEPFGIHLCRSFRPSYSSQLVGGLCCGLWTNRCCSYTELFLVVACNYVWDLHYISPNCKETWTGFSWKAFSGIWPYFKLTLASAIMLCLEIWYNQGLVLISGLLANPTISLDSISICMNYLNWDMQFMLGLAAAASVRVSNELGAGHPKVAKFSVFVVNGTSILISIVFSAIVLIFKAGLSRLFTSDVEVIEAVSNLTPLLAISVFLNGIQPILSGVAIGSGWQGVVAYVNLTCYYIIGLPIGCVLAFRTSMGVAGIWWGMIIGVFLQTATLIVLTARTNWDAQVVNAAERVKRSASVEHLLLEEDDV